MAELETVEGDVKIEGPNVSEVLTSKYCQEMARHEQFVSRFTGFPGMAGANPVGNPWKHREFPFVLYRAERVNGNAVVIEPEPHPYDFQGSTSQERAERHDMACKQVNHRNSQRMRTVFSEEERNNAMNERTGWRKSVEEALAYLHATEKEESTLAAARNYEDRGMSEAAKRESAAAEAANDGRHLPAVPEKRAYRRKKVAVPEVVKES